MSDRRRLGLGLALLLAGATVTTSTGAATQEAPQSTADLRQRAERGDRAAQLELGIELMMTNNAPALVEARRWLRMAMEAGDAEAKNAYANSLMHGGGGPRDEVEGRRLLEEAATEGWVGAHLTLSGAYQNGLGGFPRDPARAFSHMQAAAAGARGEGAPLAYWQLGIMHLSGIGTPADLREAYRWVARAAEAGGINGMISNAVTLATGEGVEEDDEAARLWYERAAEAGQRGFGHALRGLGAMLVLGEGGPADLPRGIAYLRIAQASGDQEAAALLERWRDRITDEVDRQASTLANRWMAEHMPATNAER